ncbi:MAG: AAA family ATPase [Chloroflexota bacterium]
MIKFPYGRRDFYELITENYLYVDRTNHIRFIEEWGKELIFLRPRRFGKSLWLSTLMNYYDIAREDDFTRLFGHLAIGQEPTSMHSRYMVMRWDFSCVAVSGGIEDIQESLNTHINNRIQRFITSYQYMLKQPIQIQSDAFGSFESLMTSISHSQQKLYLFIDEYDNFGNEVLMVPKQKTERETEAHRQRYINLVKGEGLFKTLFKNLKSAGSGDGLDRVFMTGVSPIVLSDVTSGANTFQNISWRPELNELCGFTKTEVHKLALSVFDSPKPKQRITDKETELLRVMTLMENYYNGSLFIDDFYDVDMANLPKVYNPTLVFYFLTEFQSRGYYPKQLLDENLTPDDHKLFHIAGYREGSTVIDDAFAEDRHIHVRTLRTKFGVTDLLNENLQSDRLALLLCYLGALTSAGETIHGQNILQIPNLVIQKLYSERVLTQNVESDSSKVEAGMAAADELFATGNMGRLCTFAQEHLLRIYTGRETRDFNEETLKTIFMMLLYHTDLYLIYSEAQIERSFGDLLMLVRPGMRRYALYDILIEFKQLPLSQATEAVSTHKGKTIYKALKEDDVRTRSRDELVALKNVDAKFEEARVQLRKYRQKLVKQHGDDLRLRCYAVVSVGFDRILWDELKEEA